MKIKECFECGEHVECSLEITDSKKKVWMCSECACCVNYVINMLHPDMENLSKVEYDMEYERRFLEAGNVDEWGDF